MTLITGEDQYKLRALQEFTSSTRRDRHNLINTKLSWYKHLYNFSALFWFFYNSPFHDADIFGSEIFSYHDSSLKTRSDQIKKSLNL